MDSTGAFFLDGVRHGNHAQQRAFPSKEQGRFPLGSKDIGLGTDGFRNVTAGADEVHAAAANDAAVQLTDQSIAWQGTEISRFIRHIAAKGGDDCLGKRMLGLALQSDGCADQLDFRITFHRQHVRHNGLAGGDGAGLIQGDNLHPARILQRSSGFEQDAVLRAHAAAHHDGHRRRQAQGAGAGNHQHGDRACETVAHVFAQEQPNS